MGLAQMRLHPGTLTARHGHEAAVARLGSDQCERGHAARQGSSMGRRAAPVAPSSRLTMLSLFSLFLSTSMTPSRCSLLSHTLSPQICHGGGLRSGVGAARGGLRSETKVGLPCGISTLSPSWPPLPSLYICCMNQFVHELICDVLNPSPLCCMNRFMDELTCDLWMS